MGSADAAQQLLQYWIREHKPDFQPDATNSFEATVANSVQNVSTSLGLCSCTFLVTPRLQNNYGTLNGGCMAALACVVAGAALESVSARSGTPAGCSTEYMSAMPGNAVVEVLAKVSAVTDSSAAVVITLRDAKSKRLVAKAHYTELTPHGIRAKATSYMHNAASAAKAALQRLQQNAESIRHKAGDILFEDSHAEHAEHAEPVWGHARKAASAYVASATSTVKSAAQKLQHAAGNALQPASDEANPSSSAQDHSEALQHVNSLPEAAPSLANALQSASESAPQLAVQSASKAASRLVSSAKELMSSVAVSSCPGSQSGSQSASQSASQSSAQSASQSSSQAESASSSASQASTQLPQMSISHSPPELAKQPQTEASTSHTASATQQSEPQQPSEQRAESHGALQTTAMPQRARLSLLQRANMVTEGFRDDDCRSFDTVLGCALKDIKVGQGTCSAVLPTAARLSDAQNMLHAGCYCSLVDLISTTALAAVDKRPAVSVTISVDFYAGLPIGEELGIEVCVIKTGKSLTFAEVDFRQLSTGDLVAQGTHVEFSAGGAPYPDTIQEYHQQQLSRQRSSKL